MCGIAGTVGFGDADLVRAMTDTIAHRGPDGDGFFVGDGVCLGNRRLAILDVAGRRPADEQRGRLGRRRLQRRDLQLPRAARPRAAPRPPPPDARATPSSSRTSTRRRASGSPPA